MPGPPIRKPSDHSPPAGSPRNIAGHHVLHRPLMPRHPPNAQKNKQQHTTKHLSQTYSKMLASTIQFTTNPPTPTPTTHNKGKQKSRPGNQGALPQNPDSMPPPTHTKHAKGTHHQQTTTTTTAATAHHHSGRVSYANTNNQPHPRATNPQDTISCPFPQEQPPAGPDPSTAQTTTTRKPPPHNTYP